MVDIATLGIRVESDQVAQADNRLDGLTASATQAEGAVERTGRAMATTDGHARNMAMAMDMAQRRSQVLAQSGLNLGRQFTDVGVTLAMGMNPFMVALQQGPQIIDAFQVAALQMGTTVRGSMVAMGAAIWTAMAPLLPFIAAIGAAVGAMAIAFGFATRAASQSIGDLTAEMGLSQAELKRLEDQGVSTTTTMGDVFRGLGTTIKEGFFAVFGDELETLGRNWTRFLDDAQRVVVGAVRNISAGFMAALYAIRAGWSMLPAALGDVAFMAADAVLSGVERMINVGIGLINTLIRQANRAADAIPGMEAFIPELDEVRLQRQRNAYAGAARDLFATIGRESAIGAQEGLNLLDRVAARGINNIRASGQARIENALGDRDTNRTAGERAGRAIAEGVAAGARERWGGLAPERIFAIPTPQRVELERLVPPEITTDLDLLIARLEETADAAKRMGQGLSSAFGEPGRIAADLLSITSTYNRQVAQVIATEKDATKSAQMRRDLQVQAYGDLAGAAKGFFEENSAGYRALETVERAYRAFQLASSIAAIAQGWIETSQSVAQATAKAGADTAAGGAKMFSQLGVFAFPAVAAMVAVLAGLGARGGGGAVPSLPTTNTGTGTVLGGANDPSQSIANSLEMAERYYDSDLRFSSQMVDSLRAIRDNIGAVTTAIARQVGVGGSFDTSGLNLGTTTGGGFLGIGQTTRTRDLVDQGLQLSSGSLADLIAGGVQGLAYQVVQTTKTKSGFLGIGGGTSTFNTETSSAIDQALASQLGQLLGSLRDGVLSAATVLGVQGAGAVLDTFRVELGRISFEGMSNAEVSEALSAVFSKVGDQMAGAIIPGLEAFQRAGEGLMETLTRLAVEYQTVDDVLSSIGMTFRTVGLESIEARTRLVELSGGLDAFIESADLFASEFLSDAQRLAPVQAAVNAELTRLGIATDITREQFASLVMGLDVSTASGAAMYAALMNLAPALDTVLDASDDLARSAAEAAARIMEQGRSLSIGLANAVGNSALALQMQREDTLAGLDPSLRGLQRVVWEAEDMARRQTEAQNAVNAASQALTQTYEREANVLRSTADRFRGFARSLGDFRRSLEGADSASGGYAAARTEFERVSGLARLGNEEALGQLQGVSEAYLRESQGYHKTSLDYLRDLGAVRQALQQAEDVAGRTATNAERQLEEITRMAGGVDQVGTAVQSVAEAINRLADAQSALGQVNAPGGRNWGANPMVNQLLAAGTGYSGDFGSGGWQKWIEQQDEATKQLARTILKATGQDFRISNFAAGAVFTSPQVFSMGASGIGRMAEAGPEAIMPLTWGPDGLGVRATNDNGELVAEFRALRQEMADMKAAMVSTAVHTARTEANTRRTADDLEQVVQGGTSINVVTEAA